MFIVLWTSSDQSLCTRDYVPEGVHRHCHHCRPSPRRPSCAPCCPRSTAPAVGVAVCMTPPPSPDVKYTTLPPSPRVATALPSSRSTSPCSIGHSRTPKSRSRASSNPGSVGLSRDNDAITITIAVAPTTCYTLEPLPPPPLEAHEPAHKHAPHGPRPSRDYSAHHHSNHHHSRDDRVAFHPGCDAQHQLRSAAEFRCRRGLLECPGLDASPIPMLHSGR